jgi:hypothetical protein
MPSPASLKVMDAFPALLEAQDDPLMGEPIAYLGGQPARLLWRDTARRVPRAAVLHLRLRHPHPRRDLGWIDEPRALYVPGATSALGIFLMRQYVASAIPRELLDAARMDGCSEFRLLFGIVMPLLGPALGTLGLVTFSFSARRLVAGLTAGAVLG